jgi:hypothetical protein
MADPSTDLRWYNAPSVDKIALIIPGDQTRADGPIDPCNINLHHCEGGLQIIHDHHHTYAPLHYVLLFPYGMAGWTYGLSLENGPDNASQEDNNANDSGLNKHITQIQFHSYHLHMRPIDISKYTKHFLAFRHFWALFS